MNNQLNRMNKNIIKVSKYCRVYGEYLDNKLRKVIVEVDNNRLYTDFVLWKPYVVSLIRKELKVNKKNIPISIKQTTPEYFWVYVEEKIDSKIKYIIKDEDIILNPKYQEEKVEVEEKVKEEEEEKEIEIAIQYDDFIEYLVSTTNKKRHYKQKWEGEEFIYITIMTPSKEEIKKYCNRNNDCLLKWKVSDESNKDYKFIEYNDSSIMAMWWTNQNDEEEE